ncbi:unannotated protein [freshwater metagenome]|uniref:Unannotated protein n=1 Tax=freshwater metagenome TaxID=449393 RepID=A0A6J6KUS9_9ZZZZ
MLGGHGDGARATTAIRVECDQIQAVVGCDPLKDVTIGRKIGGINDDGFPTRPRRNRCEGQLVEIHRRGVTHQCLAGACAKRGSGEKVTGHLGLVNPVGPAPDELSSPFAGQKRIDGLNRCQRKATQRVAIQITLLWIRVEKLCSERR